MQSLSHASDLQKREPREGSEADVALRVASGKRAFSLVGERGYAAATAPGTNMLTAVSAFFTWIRMNTWCP